MLDPVPQLPDDTPIQMVRLSTVIRNALVSAGFKTIGDIRAMPDGKLRSKRRIGAGTFAYLRRTLGSKAPADRTQKIHKLRPPG
jgi:hypothetical protein